MAIDYGVRSGLRGAGYTDEEVGFDPNTGYVKVRGQNFMKPEMNVQGTTYTSQENFNNALNQFRQNQQQPVSQPQMSPVNTQTSPGTSYVNPADQQLMDLLGMVRSRITSPQPYDVYSSPEFRAAQQQGQYGAQQAIGAGQEALGTTGMARSSDLARFAQNVQNEANQRLMTQVVPQLIAQNRAQQQQELANYFPLINALATQQQTGDIRQQREIENQRTAAGLTGYYMPSGATESINRVLNLKQQAEQPGVTPEQMAQFRALADQERARLSAMGVDPNIVGFEAGYGQAAQNVAGFRGIPTMQARQFDAQQAYQEWQKQYQEGRANAQDTQFWAKMQQDAQQAAASQGLQWAQLNQRQQEMEINKAYQQKQNQFNQGLSVFKETGQMPEYMREFGVDPVALNNAATQQDVLTLYDQISSGKLKPEQALKIIDDKVKLGAESPQDAEIVKNAIYTLYPNLRPGAEQDNSPASLGIIRPVGMETAGDIEKEVGQKVKQKAGEYLPRFGEWWLKTLTDNLQGRPFGIGG